MSTTSTPPSGDLGLCETHTTAQTLPHRHTYKLVSFQQYFLLNSHKGLKMAQQLRAFGVSQEAPSLIPSTHVRWLELVTLFWVPQALKHKRQTLNQAIHTHIHTHIDINKRDVLRENLKFRSQHPCQAAHN